MSEGRLSWIPLLLFALFAVFWSAWDIVLGEWTGLIPSILVALLLGVAALRTDKGGAS